MSVIPIYLDLETQPGYGKTWEVRQLGLFNPDRQEDSCCKSWMIRIKPDDSETLPFFKVFEQAISWIEETQKEGDTVLLIGHNISTDVSALKQTCERFTLAWPSHWKRFDTLPLSRRVNPFKSHALQYIRHKLGVPSWEQHQAAPDARGLFEVFKTMADPVDMDEVHQLCIHEKSLDLVSERIMKGRKVVPIFYDLTLSGYCKKEKFEKDEENKILDYPRVIAINAFCPYRSDNQRFSSLVQPPMDTEIDPEYSDGLTLSDLQEQSTFREVFPSFKKWTRECLEGDPTGRTALIAYSNFKHMNTMLELECENSGRLPSKRWIHFDLSYLKSCVVSGCPFEPEWINGRDQNFYRLLKRYGIDLDDDCVDQTHQLYEALLGPSNKQAIAAAMLEKPNIKPVGEIIKTHFTAHPIFVDTETTGLPENGKWKEIVQISAFAPLRRGKKNQWFTKIVNPKVKIPKEAIAVHHITNQKVKKAPDWSVIGEQLAEWVFKGLKPEEKPVFICHNAYFDLGMIKSEYMRYGMEMPLDIRSFCTLNLSRTLRKGRNGHKLEELAEVFGVTNPKAHDAEGDVATTYEIFKHLIAPLTRDEAYDAIMSRKNQRSPKEVALKIREARSDDSVELISIATGKGVKRIITEGSSKGGKPAKRIRKRGGCYK